MSDLFGSKGVGRMFCNIDKAIQLYRDAFYAAPPVAIIHPCPECGEECENRFREHSFGDFHRWECTECDWVGEPDGFVAALKIGQE